MYSFFRKNQKFVMVVMVVLMVAFIIPTFFNRGQRNLEQVAGSIGDEKIYKDEIQSSENEWNFLLQHVQVQTRDPQSRGEWIPIVAAVLPQHVFMQMRETPELYYLLQLEARKMGLSPSLDDSRNLLAQENVAVVTYDQRRVPISDSTDQQLNEQVEYHLANLLLVTRSFARAAAAIKISQPLATYEIATDMQQIKAQVADFWGKDYEDKVPAPTPQQLQEQFDRFADVEPDGPPSEKNPFGFGYKFPDRVKLQYIGVPRDQVANAIRATRDSYDWDVEAHKYYDKHLNEFPSTQPATTKPDEFSIGSSSSAKGPTTRPFEEVHQFIVTKLIDAQVERVMPQIVSEIRAKLATDYEAYRGANPSPSSEPAPATPPTTGRAAPYASFEYLQNLAHEIEARHHVTLTVASINDSFKTEKDLEYLAGIGHAVFQGDRPIPFPQYAIGSAEAFLPADRRQQANVLSLYAPSKPMTDGINGTVWFFRLTEAQPAHRPANVEEVKDQVAWDWKRAQSLELARAEAQKLLEKARTEGLAAAATSAGRRFVTTGPFPKVASVPINNYPLSTRAQQNFVDKTYDLMGQLSKFQKDGIHPVALIDLALAGKVAVTELVAVESSVKPDMVEQFRDFISDQMLAQYRQVLAADWFNFDSVVERLGYQDSTGRHLTQKQRQQQQQSRAAAQ